MTDKITPCIIIPGIGHSITEQLDENGKRLQTAWPLHINTEKVTKELKSPLIKSILSRRDAGLSDKAAQIFSTAIDPIATKDDGTMKNNIRVVKYPKSLKDCATHEKRYIYRMVPMQKLGEIIGEENLYFFTFNSFGEPYKTADELDEFIQKIKSEQGCDKVNLIPISLGGAMSVAYFDAYGYKNDIKRVLYFAAALQGTPVISDLIDRRITPDRAVKLVEVFSNRKTANVLKMLIGLLPKNVREKLISVSVNTFVDNVVLKCPSLWATVPVHSYDKLAEKYLSDEKYNTLRQKTDRFAKAQREFSSTVLSLKERGTEFFAVVGYDLPLLPISEQDKISSDGMIPVCSGSLGAQVAPLGSALGKTGEHISPDGTVDASASVLPDTVWYFKGQQHDNSSYSDTVLNITARIMSDDSFVSVYSDPTLPRFM